MIGCVASAQAQDAKTAPSPAPAGTITATNRTAADLSPGVSEILKMADAGVSADVLKTYVECMPTVVPPTEADIIALKQHHVADDVTTLLLKRGAQVRTAAAQARNAAVARALSARTKAAGGFDPDSYEYFQYYYLQPRALASAYQRLWPYYFYPSSGYGYPSSFGFGPFLAGRRSYYRSPGFPRHR